MVGEQFSEGVEKERKNIEIDCCTTLARKRAGRVFLAYTYLGQSGV